MKSALSIVLILFTAVVLQAQVMEDVKYMSLGEQNCLVVEIDEGDDNMIEDVLKDISKKHGKLKRNRKAKEWYVMEAQIPDIGGTGLVDAYYKIEEASHGYNLTAWYDMGGSFLSSTSNPAAYGAAKVMLDELRLEVKKIAIEEELEMQEKELEKLDRELKKLMRLNEGYHRDIEKAKERIAKAEADIEQNIIDQKNTREAITGQEKVVKAVKGRLENYRSE